MDAIKLFDDQDCPISVKWENPAGGAAKVDGPTTWTSTDGGVCTVTVDPADSTKATLSAVPDPNGGIANRECDVSASADADLGDGVKTIVALIHVVVQPEMADHGEITAGTPVTRGLPQPGTPAPAPGPAPVVGAAVTQPTQPAA